MEILGFVFGIFGIVAYMQSSSLQTRIEALERELSSIKGTSYHKDRTTLLQATKTYLNKQVRLELKENHEDIDILNYGNTKNGSITILDIDDNWLLVRIETKKKTVDKLIRLESIERISVISQ